MYGARICTVLIPCWLITSTTVALQVSPHVPTDEELEREESGIHSEDTVQTYQQRSVEEAQSWTRRALDWIRETLAGIHVTPARLALGLGILGILFTAGKNKRLVRWAVLTTISFLLAIVGLAAMVFDWPYMN